MNGNEKQIIFAGGGLVENEEGRILVMFRRGKWDLPKGKSDPGESFESCALREVEEETGVSRLQLIRFLLVTRHEYREKGKPVVKETHWFSMKAPSDQRLVPQQEEDITELRWLSPDELGIVLQNTFPRIVDVLKAGGYLKDS